MKAKIPEELLDALSAYVADRMGLHFPPERRRDLERGLLRAAPDLGFDDAESCARWLLLSPLTKHQVEALASHLTVGETYFFRDRKLFEVLEGRILPALIAERRKTERQLRIWSAGSATGEEPYSIAILLLRMIHDIDDWNITLLATDINPSFLRRSASGTYGEWSFRDVQPLVKERYFRKTGQGRHEVLPNIRKHVTFSYHNLAEDSYPSLLNNTNAMDIIFCRNVLMYFSKDRQQEVIGKFYRCLVDNGLLIVSPTETSAPLLSAFVPEHFQGATLYRKDPTRAAASQCPIPQPVFPPYLRMETAAVIAAPEVKPAHLDEAPSSIKISEAPIVKATPRPSPYEEAFALFECGRLAESEAKISAILASSGKHAAPLALLARIRANAGKLEDAGQLCEKAIAEDKLNPGYHYLRATIQQELSMLDESIASLKRALYLDHNFVLAHFSLGNLALRQEKKREASKHFENALSALKKLKRDEVLPESGGVTAGRMEEIIKTATEEVVAV